MRNSPLVLSENKNSPLGLNAGDARSVSRSVRDHLAQHFAGPGIPNGDSPFGLFRVFVR